MTQDEINQSEWSNPANFTALTYHSIKDSRIIVPRRRCFGWTINFGRVGGKILLGVLLASPVVVFGVIWLAALYSGKH